VLVAIMGLPGAGKTEIASYLAGRYPFVKLSADSIRLEHGLASGPATHEIMYQLAWKLLPEKVGLILDGIHLGKRDRERVRRVADEHAAYAAIIYATASPAIIEERLRQRLRRPEQTTGESKYVITPGHFASIASYLEEPSDGEEVFVVDTSRDSIGRQLSGLERQLRQLLTGSHT
jgi:predicted kinase